MVGRKKPKPPPNSIAYYRELKGWSRPQLAIAVNTTPQQIERLESQKRQLTLEWATRIGGALGVIAEDIGYSAASNSYGWATRGIAVVGELHAGFKITMIEGLKERIGFFTATGATKTSAIRIMPGTLPMIDAAGMWFLLFDADSTQDMTVEILDEQADGSRFIVRLFDGTTWWRRIQLGSRKHRYHLSAPGVDPILDAEIDWVARIVGVQPGRPLPPAQ